MINIKLVTSTLVLFMAISILSALPSSDHDRSLNDLYESLLQREYTGPIPLSDHQVERKAVRSPSLRLRFGRRSDPDLMPLGEKRFIQEVNQKPIRSPSLRLRFGRRSDPLMPIHPDDYEFLNYDDDTNEFEKRSPSGRLRWGRSGYPVPNELFENEWLSGNDKRAASPRLRWGRSELNGLGKSNLNDDTETKGNDSEMDKRAPAPRLRWGRSVEPSSNVEKALKYAKNAPKDQSSTDLGSN